MLGILTACRTKAIRTLQPSREPQIKPTAEMMPTEKILKQDLFGEVRYRSGPDGGIITRDTRSARPWLRPLARRLLRREAIVLASLGQLDSEFGGG
ncbi:MAG TPA: hypothetical protein PKK10_12760, partial [Woeseiaceae bacterium]|nr:hypothetical protein [Woeseiaceae bacterium]